MPLPGRGKRERLADHLGPVATIRQRPRRARTCVRATHTHDSTPAVAAAAAHRRASAPRAGARTPIAPAAPRQAGQASRPAARSASSCCALTVIESIENRRFSHPAPSLSEAHAAGKGRLVWVMTTTPPDRSSVLPRRTDPEPAEGAEEPPTLLPVSAARRPGRCEAVTRSRRLTPVGCADPETLAPESRGAHGPRASDTDREDTCYACMYGPYRVCQLHPGEVICRERRCG